MLVGIPVLIISILILFLILLPSMGIFQLDRNLVIVIVLYAGIFYAILILQKVTYSDLNVIDMVTVPGAPEKIENLLKDMTRGANRLVNVEIILTLAERELVQNRLIAEVQEKHIRLTDTQIIKYLRTLEANGILQSKKAYTREYSLTETGKWCYRTVKICFPRRQFWFIIRHYLGYMKISPLIKETKEDKCPKETD